MDIILKALKWLIQYIRLKIKHVLYGYHTYYSSGRFKVVILKSGSDLVLSAWQSVLRELSFRELSFFTGRGAVCL